MELGINGRNAIVTGGRQGIGRAWAEALAEEGVNVAIVARDADRLKAAAFEIANNRSGRVIPISGDLTNGEDIKKIMSEANSELKQIDILINNAGAAPFGRIWDLEDSIWQDCFDLKLMGYVRCAREVMSNMRERRWGRIVNIIGRG